MKTDTLNVRLLIEVKEYYLKKRGQARKILEDHFYEIQKNRLPEARKELLRRKDDVAQYEQFVAQLEQECATKQAKCATPDEETSLPPIDLKAIDKERKCRRREGR